MRKLCISNLQCFEAFRNCSLFLHIFTVMKFVLRWYAPCSQCQTSFTSSFPTFRQLCISDIQRFETFPNCCLFCTFRLLRNFYSGDAHHANYGERFSNHQFRYCANCVNQIYSVLKLFEIAVCFCTFLLLWNFYSGDAHHAHNAKRSSPHHFQHYANCVYQIYSVLKLFEISLCFAHFGFYEISTPVMRTIPIIVNFV